jgi:dTDP-4-dehydrorhamnose reductase
MEKTRVLILGSSGLIGNHLSKLLSKKYNVFNTHNKNKIFPNSIKVDILSKNSLGNAFEIAKPDVIVNLCAIYNNLEFCENNKKLVMSINGDSLEHISELSNQYSSHLIHLSSDYVFDGNVGNYKEEDKVNPINFYGKTKVVAEKNIQKIANNFCIVRTSMVFGKNKIKQTLPDWILAKINDVEKLNMISDQFTTPTYLDNLCLMLEEIISNQYLGIIHLAGATKISRFQFAEKMLMILNISPKKLVPISSKDFDLSNNRPKDSSLNTDKAKSILNEIPEECDFSIKKYLLKNSEYT